MSVALNGGIIDLTAPCRIEDAEKLLAWLQENRNRSVDLTRAGHLHAAIVQILLAFRPRLIAPVSDPFVERWIYPQIRSGC